MPFPNRIVEYYGYELVQWGERLRVEIHHSGEHVDTVDDFQVAMGWVDTVRASVR